MILSTKEAKLPNGLIGERERETKSQRKLTHGMDGDGPA